MGAFVTGDFVMGDFVMGDFVVDPLEGGSHALEMRGPKGPEFLVSNIPPDGNKQCLSIETT